MQHPSILVPRLLSPALVVTTMLAVGVSAQRTVGLRGSALERGAPFPRVVGPRSPAEEDKLFPANVDQFSNYGASLSLDGSLLLVGASTKAYNGLNYAGAAYVFRKSGSGWTEEAELLTPAPEIHDNFGADVAIQGDLAVVGAPDFPYSSFTGTGRALVFRRVAGVWTLEVELTASDAATHKAFGREVALDGNTIMVGDYSDGQGAVYVFEHDGASWTETQKLTSPLPFAGYGREICLQGELALISAWRENVGTIVAAGSVHVLRYSAGTWTDEALIFDPEPEDFAEFGDTLAFDGDVALVGASKRADVFAYRQQGTTWPLEEHIKNPLPAPITLFGESLALSGDVALIGAANHSYSTTNGGAVFLYRYVEQEWLSEGPFVPADNAIDQGFGLGLALDGTTAAIGTWEDAAGFIGAGAAYVYDVTDVSNGFRLLVKPLPIEVGEDLEIAATGGRPSRPTFLLQSLDGPGTVYPLANPSVLALQVADPDGDAAWTFPVPPSMAGTTVWYQAVQTGAQTSVVASTVQ